MEELKSLPTENLLDLLSEHTEKYGHIIRAGSAHPDFENIRRMLNSLQDEIKLRQPPPSSHPDIDFKTDRIL
jgi:hypothetical protein